MKDKQLAPWQQLLVLLEGQTPAGIPCTTHHLETLSLFIADELAGKEVDSLHPTFAQHLDTCTMCMKEYFDLTEWTLQTLYV